MILCIIALPQVRTIQRFDVLKSFEFLCYELLDICIVWYVLSSAYKAYDIIT